MVAERGCGRTTKMASAEETLLIPKDLNDAKELVNKLGIEDLKTFCFTFGLPQDGTKANLKERLLEYYKGKFPLVSGTPVPTPRKKSAVKSPDSKEKEMSVSEAIGNVEQKLEQSISSFADQLRNSDDRIDRIEVSVNKINAYVEESLATFRVSLTEALMASTEKMMRSFMVPADTADSPSREKEQKLSEISSSSTQRKLNFVIENARDVCVELKKSLASKAIPSRVERQVKRLNNYESDCVRSVAELLTNVVEEDLVQRVLEEWDEFRSEITPILEKADEYLEAKAASSTTNDLANENITGVKLLLLQLPRFSGNVLEWSGFYDAFIASVDSHKKLSNVQKFTHLRSCLSGKAYHCIEGYSVTNDNYTKALQDLKDRFGRKRLLVNELVKSIISLEVPETAEGKAIRPLYDTLKNRMRSLESLGLKPDDNLSLSMVLLPIFDTKLPRELKEKWEFELTKCENDDEVNIKKFFQFLEGHVLSKEAIEDQRSSLQKYRRRSSRRPGDEEDMSAASLMGASENKKLKCGFCGKNHETTKCPAALSKTPEER